MVRWWSGGQVNVSWISSELDFGRCETCYYYVIVSCKDAAQQVLMSSVCVQVEILPHSKLYNKQQTETNLDQPRPTQTNPDQPRPSKTNQDQPRPTKTNQDQPRPTKTNPDQPSPYSVQFSPIQSYSVLQSGQLTGTLWGYNVKKKVCSWSRFCGVTSRNGFFEFHGVSLTPRKGFFVFHGVTPWNGFF